MFLLPHWKKLSLRSLNWELPFWLSRMFDDQAKRNKKSCTMDQKNHIPHLWFYSCLALQIRSKKLKILSSRKTKRKSGRNILPLTKTGLPPDLPGFPNCEENSSNLCSISWIMKGMLSKGTPVTRQSYVLLPCMHMIHPILPWKPNLPTVC